MLSDLYHKVKMVMNTKIVNTITKLFSLLRNFMVCVKKEEAKISGGSSRNNYERYFSLDNNNNSNITILIGGLTLVHDQLCRSALHGLGYNVETLPCPDNTALQTGKEFGNRGQCNPTYYTVGNLIKYLCHLRDVMGMSVELINQQYVFLTAGACGPCRFGMYVTEYRKALHDAGFEGFRVFVFQQQGGINQLVGNDINLKLNWKFAYSVVQALMIGDILNLLGYRLRPYEINRGETDKILGSCNKIISNALERKSWLLYALLKCRKMLSKIEVNRTVPKPVVSIIGEFWAMTTEGDGNYRLQRYLEAEGAEVDIQIITNWLLYMIWENIYDTKQRLILRSPDESRKGLADSHPSLKIIKLIFIDKVIKNYFYIYAWLLGLYRYQLPNLNKIARLARKYYDNNVRGGEGHMEVGKLIHFIDDRINHMTISVKPFGCMPSSGVSDGIQSLIVATRPNALFLPIETTGDSEVSVQSRVQMILYKAKQRAKQEFDIALKEVGLTESEFTQQVLGKRKLRKSFFRAKHRTAGQACNLVYMLKKINIH